MMDNFSNISYSTEQRKRDRKLTTSKKLSRKLLLKSRRKIMPFVEIGSSTELKYPLQSQRAYEKFKSLKADNCIGQQCCRKCFSSLSFVNLSSRYLMLKMANIIVNESYWYIPMCWWLIVKICYLKQVKSTPHSCFIPDNLSHTWWLYSHEISKSVCFLTYSSDNDRNIIRNDVAEFKMLTLWELDIKIKECNCKCP